MIIQLLSQHWPLSERPQWWPFHSNTFPSWLLHWIHLSLPHGAKSHGRAGLSASGQFQTGSILSRDYSGRFVKCLNRLTKTCFYVNMEDLRGRRYQNNKRLDPTAALSINVRSISAPVSKGEMNAQFATQQKGGCAQIQAAID